MMLTSSSTRHEHSRQISTKTVIVFSFGIVLGWLGATSLSIHRTPSCFPMQTSIHSATENTDVGKETDTDLLGWKSMDIFVGPSTIDSPTHWVAQARQDEAIFSLLGNKTDGIFVDLAANDAVQLSNTYSLEKHHGWKGVCIEPNPLYWYNLTHFRPHCHIVGAVVGSQRNQDVPFYFQAGDHGGIVGFDNGPKFTKDSRTAYTVTLREVLQRYIPSNNHIDYLSLDVEGAEEFILKDFPLDEYKIQLLTVERPKEGLRAVLEAHGFEQLQRLSRWGETLWAHKSARPRLDLSRLDDFSGRNQYLADKTRREKGQHES